MTNSNMSKIAFVNTPATNLSVIQYGDAAYVAFTAEGTCPVLAVNKGSVREGVNYSDMLAGLAGKVPVLVLGIIADEGIHAFPDNNYTVLESIAIKPVQASDAGIELTTGRDGTEQSNEANSDAPVAFVDAPATKLQVIQVEDYRLTVLVGNGTTPLMFGGPIHYEVPVDFILGMASMPSAIVRLLTDDELLTGAVKEYVKFKVLGERDLAEPLLASEVGVELVVKTPEQAQQTLH